MFYVYVIKSRNSDRPYVGQTSDLEKRLKQHNDPCNDFSRHTKQNKGPRKLIYKEEVLTRSEALRREKFLKRERVRVIQIPG